MQHETQTHRGTAGTTASNTGLFREWVYARTEVSSFLRLKVAPFLHTATFWRYWRGMTIDHARSSSEGPFKMQFCSDHSWLILNYVSVVVPLSCFAHVVMLFFRIKRVSCSHLKNGGNVRIFVFPVLKVHFSKSPNARLLKNYICSSKGSLHFPQIKSK